MDLQNSALGQLIGMANSALSDEAIADLVYQASVSGEGLYLSPLSSNPFYAPANGVFPGTVLTPTNK